METFLFLDYTTLALAKVWTNRAKLPNSQTMRALYEKIVEERGGYGKYVLFLGPQRFLGKPFLPFLVLGLTSGHVIASIAYLIGWLNEAAAKYGGKQVRCIRSRRDPETDCVDLGRWITKIVRRSQRLASCGHEVRLMRSTAPKRPVVTGKLLFMEARSS